ncbi:PREDICTED: UTP--glucose-1-phosphate uridylyltransferase-like [Amphimedon queenslandica]|uniref:Uncharacterized protein n=2 Tax=Amphimedon queenslandica TaxID=400682 RepID=A0A1X7UKL0_AMPQE|nr:PREDICTED: UTP--glucose-1-phosphate uridylyltransferase-like [Amphimedon queenslandica]|eukprot:XP_019853714.1 PREDICTED: UTP--glucose-1-phosphate uridylyltransferase-like [Amphimedon queenslandica]
MSSAGVPRVGSPTLERHESVILMEKDVALAIVQNDLEQLVALADPINQKNLSENLLGFKELFGRYLENRNVGAKVEWGKIKQPPEGAVSDHVTL